MQPHEIKVDSDVVAEYASMLDKATTLDKLVFGIRDWSVLCHDAKKVIDTMTQDDFKLFRKALKLERSGRPCSDEAFNKFSSVFVPDAILKVLLVSRAEHRTWGVAFLELCTRGRVTFRDGGCYVHGGLL